MSPIVDSTPSTASASATLGSEEPAAISGAIEPPDTMGAVAAALKTLDISTNSSRNGALVHQPSLGSSFPPPTSRTRLSDRLGNSNLVLHGVPISASPGSRPNRHTHMTSSNSIDSQMHYDHGFAIPASPSMSEGLTDSPGSVSSISSFRRGDLADIEDLDLEPELETVSECDEESSSLCSLDIGVDLDSDSERASSHGGDIEHPHSGYGLGFASHQSRAVSNRPSAGGTAASDYARRKRSEWLLNNYANKIAARRPRRVRKGRVAEIVEEGGDSINTTIMPKASCASISSDWACDVSGPPVPPPRSVSPSDTVPARPSPLCSCVNAEAAAGSTNTAGLEESVETIKADDDRSAKPLSGDPSQGSHLEDSSVKPSDSTDGEHVAPSSADAKHVYAGGSPSSSPRNSRISGRRNSSPPRLRPCFRRRTSQQSASSTRESSCERDPPRGRSVRFSSGPPQEMRTHSPVEYDRKSCPVNNRLSPEDVEELRTMKMEMGLLEARWAAVAACKPRKVEGTEGTTKPENHSAYNAGIAAMNASRHRPRACGAESDSTLGPGSTSSPSARLRQQKEKERLQERQRNLPHYLRNRPGCVEAKKDTAASEALSVRNKFGHAPPPPLPGLPQARTSSSPSPSRSPSTPRVDPTPSQEGGERGRSTSHVVAPHLSVAPQLKDVPVLTETQPSPPTSPAASKAALDKVAPLTREDSQTLDRSRLSASDCTESPRRLACAAPPSPSPWSSCPSSSTPSIFSSTYYPSSSQPSMTSYPSFASGGSGYDSPASEFYESGSEYDLVC